MRLFFTTLSIFAALLSWPAFRAGFDRFLAWLLAPLVVWTWILSTVVLAFFFRELAGTHESGFKWAGLLLQLLGIAVVVWGIDSKLARRGKTSLRAFLSRWTVQLMQVFIPPKPITGNLKIAMENDTFRLSGTIVAARKRDSLEERVAALELDLVDIRTEVAHGRQQLQQEAQALRGQIDELQRNLEQRLSSEFASFDDIAVGSAQVELLGVLWVVSGSVFATVPEWIAQHW